MKFKTISPKLTAYLVTITLLLTMIPIFSLSVSAAPAGYTVIRLSDITPGTTHTISDDGNYWITGSSTTPHNVSIKIGDTSGEPAIYSIVLDNAYISPLTASTSAGNYLSDWTGALCLTEGAMVNLYLNGTNTLLGTEHTGPGIEVPENTYLTIDSYEESGSDKGSLIARPAENIGLGEVTGAAGIGAMGYFSTADTRTVGSIAIRGGTINAYAYDGAAAIGGITLGTTGSITITGGTVNAYANTSIGAAAIGGGFGGTVESINISGGKITTKTIYGANIGAGTNTSDSESVTVPTIAISGGSILPVGTSKSIGYNNTSQLFTGGSVTITGGNIMAETINPSPTNGTNALAATTVTLIGLDTETPFTTAAFAGTISDKLTGYGTNDAVTLDPNKITLWLPDGDTEIDSVTLGDKVFEPVESASGTHCCHNWQDSGYCSNCNYFDSAHASTPELADGYYRIKSANDLIWFAGYVNGDIDGSTHTSANAILVNDITLNENVLTDGKPASADSLTQFVPIGKFYMLDGVEERVEYGGTFDGNGKTISGLYVSRDYNGKTGTRSGLFGMTSPSVVIKDLHITDAYIKGAFSNGLTGVVAGYNHGLIENVHVTNAYCTTYTMYIGGIAGYMSSSGTIRNCTVRTITMTASTTDSSKGYIGGIVGCNYGGAVENCGAILSAHCSGTYVGGIAGISTETSTAACSYKNCYAVLTGSSGSYQGGISGSSTSNTTITNCYAEDNGNATKLSLSGTPKTDSLSAFKDSTAFASGEVAYLLNSQLTDGAWRQTIGTDDYPNFTGAPVAYSETDGYYNLTEIALDTQAIALKGFNDDAVLIAASYADGKLLDIRLIPVTGDYQSTLSATGLNTSGADRLKAFLVNSMTNLKPVYESKTVSVK